METIRNFDKLVAERSANAALDYSVITRLMREVVKHNYPEIKTINSISYETYKRRVGQHHSAFNYGYTIHATRPDGSRAQLLLIYSAHTDGSRAYAYEIMRELIASGFNEGPFRIIRPLEYRDDLQALIYEGTPGSKLFTYMQKKASVTDLSHCVTLVAHWIKKFHTQQLTDRMKKLAHTFDWQNINTPIMEIMADVKRLDTAQGEKLEHFVAAFGKQERNLSAAAPQGLVYGDLHPENIIVPELRAGDLTMIDFTDVSIGDQLRDIGTFIQQMQFMGKPFYSLDELQVILHTHLEAYFGKPFTALSQDEFARINLYQAWNALRSFVYFFYLGEARVASYGLLEDAWRYLYLSEHKESSIDLRY